MNSITFDPDFRPPENMNDTLLLPSWIAPVEPARTVLADHAVLVRDTRIEAVLPRADALARHPDARRVELPGHLLIPGLVNLHTHAAMALLRGAGDDLPLHTWLNERIWPLEGALMSDEFVFDGTLLACREMLRGGVTCFNDMYFHHDAVARAADAAGLRAMVGISVLEFPTGYASGPAQYLERGFQAREAWAGHDRIGFTLAPHAPYTVGDDTFRTIVTYAHETGMRINCHVHETAKEVADALAADGRRPLARLDALGVLGPEFIAVHAVHLDDADIALLARRGASVAHCPHSNLKLASGFARTAELLAAGVNLGVGTDGSASNNRLDLLAEGRSAALLAKAASADAAAWDAHAALEAMTLSGARALGLEARIGSIVPGKDADLVAVDLSDADFRPVHDPVSQLLYMGSREQVTEVWVAGRNVVSARRLACPQAMRAMDDAIARIGMWQNRINGILSAR